MTVGRLTLPNLCVYLEHLPIPIIIAGCEDGAVKKHKDKTMLHNVLL